MLKRLLFAVVLVAGASQPALAEQGDPENGRWLARTCHGCHGIPFHQNVYPTYSVPLIAGQSYGYLVSALRAYQTGERRHPTMQAQAATLSEQDIRDISAFLAQQREEQP
ncbi:MAG: c-type cytochrome [Wenzhouxiangella sp.]